MARAAAKRNRSAGKAARPVTAEPKRRAQQKPEKTLEDELFFTRLRGHAKWAFALLAVVFAGSFVFLGVGSGNAGLGDVFSNVFSGGGAPSIEELQEKVAERPRDKQVLTDLAQALERDGRTAEAVSAYRAYLATRPKDEEILAALALVFQTQAAAAYNELSLAARDVSLADPGAQFRPGAARSVRRSGRSPIRSARRHRRRLSEVSGGDHEVPVREQGRSRRVQAALDPVS